MTRIPSITDRSAVPLAAYPAFDAITASRGSVRGPFAVLMHSPEVAARVAHLGTFVRFESSLATKVKELAVITAVRESECAYEWGTHVVSGREAGISDTTIEAVRQKAPLSTFPVEEQLYVRYAREMVRDHKVSDEAFAPVHAALGDAGIAELTVAIGYYALLACVLNTFEVQPLPGAATML